MAKNRMERPLVLDADRAMESLRGGLWHTTSPIRFKGIRLRKAILRDPPIPDDERWATGLGREGWPYVRTLGGVSLFDFDGFDPVAYSARCPLSSWRAFVPFRKDWGASVWIEIDRKKAAQELIGANELVARQKRENALRHRIMPYIEACYLGDIPSCMFVRVLLIESSDTDFRRMEF